MKEKRKIVSDTKVNDVSDDLNSISSDKIKRDSHQKRMHRLNEIAFVREMLATKSADKKLSTITTVAERIVSMNDKKDNHKNHDRIIFINDSINESMLKFYCTIKKVEFMFYL